MKHSRTVVDNHEGGKQKKDRKYIKRERDTEERRFGMKRETQEELKHNPNYRKIQKVQILSACESECFLSPLAVHFASDQDAPLPLSQCKLGMAPAPPMTLKAVSRMDGWKFNFCTLLVVYLLQKWSQNLTWLNLALCESSTVFQCVTLSIIGL